MFFPGSTLPDFLISVEPQWPIVITCSMALLFFPYFLSVLPGITSQETFGTHNFALRSASGKTQSITTPSTCMHTPEYTHPGPAGVLSCTSVRSNPGASWGIKVPSILEHDWTGPSLESRSFGIWPGGKWFMERVKSIHLDGTSLAIPSPPSQVCSPLHFTMKYLYLPTWMEDKCSLSNSH